MNDETRLQRARTFDEIAELYDQARRACPDQLLSDLFAQAGIEPVNASVLEIGCGDTSSGSARMPHSLRGDGREPREHRSTQPVAVRARRDRQRSFRGLGGKRQVRYRFSREFLVLARSAPALC